MHVHVHLFVFKKIYTSDLRTVHGTYKTSHASCCTQQFVFPTVGRIHPPKISNSL